MAISHEKMVATLVQVLSRCANSSGKLQAQKRQVDDGTLTAGVKCGDCGMVLVREKVSGGLMT